MDELVEWLRAQLDEDERIARSCARTDWWEHPVNWVSAAPMHRVALVAHDGDRRHIVEHDPARVLREIDADRALIADYVSAQETVDAIAHPDMYDVGRAQGLEDAVRRRASAYDQRPGYREEWRP
ncbi:MULTISPECIES: DUF6221 family protein [unclassified Streptomyces]|uniref:DUF6221 family protein n=1 Tax=unclassified Streptomyces TaxID=2593676 RepID=UPI0036F032A8